MATSASTLPIPGNLELLEHGNLPFARQHVLMIDVTENLRETYGQMQSQGNRMPATISELDLITSTYPPRSFQSFALSQHPMLTSQLSKCYLPWMSALLECYKAYSHERQSSMLYLEYIPQVHCV